MKKITKVVSLALVGAMVFSVPVMAKETGATVATYIDSASNVGKPSITVAAIDEGKVVGEYAANAIEDIWGSEEVVPVAQGGKVVIDGEETNVTLNLGKPELSRVNSAREYAASINSKVLNAVKIKTHVAFEVANVNFYMPGITGTENIHVFQYDKASDSWVELNVTEVREDHVVVDLTKTGVVAFIQEP